MFESMGFDERDYRYMKEQIGNAVERVREFVSLEVNNPPRGV